MTNIKNFRTLLVVSLGIAVLAFSVPWLSKPASDNISVMASALLALLWSAVVLLALFSFRKRGLWFLLGTPLALFWPFLFLLILHDFSSL